MNYYIQGDAANADKIRAAFEKLGYDTSRHLFNAMSVLYFTMNQQNILLNNSNKQWSNETLSSV